LTELSKGNSLYSCMQDISFSIFTNNKIQQISLQDLLKNKRVLICSATRNGESVSNGYFTYLRDLESQYKELYNIDVYVIVANKLSLAGAIVRRANVTLYDTNKSFIQYLATKYNKTLDIDILFHTWNYQVLFNNGEIEQFYEQPTENCMKYVLEHTWRTQPAEFNGWFVWKLKNQQPEYLESDELFHRRRLGTFENNIKIGKALFYYKLWPNTELDQYLLDTSSNIVV